MRFCLLLVAASAWRLYAEPAEEPGKSPTDVASTNLVDLGFLPSLDEFFKMLDTNSSQWEPVEGTVDLLFADQVEPELFSTPSTSGDLIARQESTCNNWPPAVAHFCEVMPHRGWIYGGGAAIAIYYAPNVLTNFLNKIADVIVTWRALRATWHGTNAGHDGGIGPLLRRHLELGWSNSSIVHFKVPVNLEGLARRGLDNNVIAEAQLFDEYLYNPETSDLVPYGTSGGLSVDASEPHSKADTLQRRQLTYWYTINFRVLRRTYVTVSGLSRNCVTNELRRLVNRSSERARHTCNTVDMRYTPWGVVVGISINPGENQYGMSVSCCYM